jgi:hypothetical protein
MLRKIAVVGWVSAVLGASNDTPQQPKRAFTPVFAGYGA